MCIIIVSYYKSKFEMQIAINFKIQYMILYICDTKDNSVQSCWNTNRLMGWNDAAAYYCDIMQLLAL